MIMDVENAAIVNIDIIKLHVSAAYAANQKEARFTKPTIRNDFSYEFHQNSSTCQIAPSLLDPKALENG
jgi:hypothetical protein